MSQETIIHQYMPSNGEEGIWFFDNWCSHCARDKAMSEGRNIDECDDDEKCELIAMSSFKDVPEWIVENGKPRCTQFVQAGSPVPQKRCENTIDMFGAESP